MDNKKILIDYTNYRSERKTREVIPIRIWFGTSQYHNGDQWFLKATDVEKNEQRDFALKDIHQFIPLT